MKLGLNEQYTVSNKGLILRKKINKIAKPLARRRDKKIRDDTKKQTTNSNQIQKIIKESFEKPVFQEVEA